MTHHLACIVSVTGGLEGPCDCGDDFVEGYKHRGDVFKEKLIEAERQRDRLLIIAERACVLGLAAICTYGHRDEHGLTGLSKKHWDELTTLEAEAKAVNKSEGRI